MIDKYVIINEDVRNKFEKKWQMPYGYGTCAIFFTFEDAKKSYDVVKYYKTKGYIIEKVNSNNRIKMYPK